MTQSHDLLHHSQARLEDCTLQRCWDKCLEQSQYDLKIQAIEAFNAQNGDVKRGLAICPIKFYPGMGIKEAMKASAFIRVYQDGTVLLTHAGIEMGQGLHTKMIQVASRALGIKVGLYRAEHSSRVFGL